ncbi:MAG: hypothetical protein C0404_12285, partial [Verrucomicrobia bacterium]|nr:hypothetical protein [Verrucomicrobiota bacterium]
SQNLYISISHPYVEWPTSDNDDFVVMLLGREQVGLDGSGKPVTFKVTRAGEKIVGGGVSLGSWTNDWTGVYRADTNSRRCEIALPWSTLEAAGLWGSNLAVNLIWNSNRIPYTGYGALGRLLLRQGGYSPLYLDTVKGLGSHIRPYTVKLHFAEMEGKAAGQRKFNVKLQGNRVLSDLDVVVEAGGQKLPLVKEFADVGVADRLTVELESVVGETMIGGVEMIGNWDGESEFPNQSPVAEIQTDVVSGPAPLAVTLSAWNSCDPDGQIADCRWDCGDGAIKRGSKRTHVFTEPGTYTVTLLVLDERGATGTAKTTVTVGAGAPAAFVCKIRASGGDYGSLNAWQAAIRGDLTSKTRLFTLSSIGSYTNTDIGKSVTFAGGGTGVLLWADPVRNEAAMVNCAGTIATGTVTVAGGRTFTVADTGVDTASLLFSVTDRGTYSQAADDGKAVTFTGGGSGYLRHINTANLAYVTECRGAVGAGTVTCAGGHTFTVSGAGSPIYTAVAECYNDWPTTGLQEGLSFSGWIGDANRTTVVRAASGHGHTGRIKDGAGKYTGFAMTAGWPSGGLFGAGRVTGIIVDGYGGVAAESINRVITKNGAITPYGTAINSLAIGSTFNAGGHNIAFYNCTSVDASRGFYCANNGYFQQSALFVNCLARPAAGGVGFGCYVPTDGNWVVLSYCASSDGSANFLDSFMSGGGRLGNRANATLTFVNAASNDFRLAETDMGARGWGTVGFGADIEGQNRQAPNNCDIGADQVTSAAVPPVITSELSASISVGVPFSYTITFTGTGPLTLGVSGLPSGLSFDGVATISGTPLSAGICNVSLTATNPGGSDARTLALNIQNQTLTSISVTPTNASVVPAAMLQFAATGLDQFGNAMLSQPSLAWNVSGGGTISASGLFTAGGSDGGPYTVTATGGGKSGTASITVSTVPSGLLAWWKLDETSGTTAADASGNGHAGTLQSGAAFTTGGKISGALQLSGANDMILASPVVSLTTEWTIGAWFTAPLPATATWHTLARGSGSSGDHQIIADSGLNLGMYDNTSGGGFRSCGYGMGGLSSGWHHLAAVGSGTTTKFYVDGVLVGTSDRKGSGDVYAVGNYQGNGQRFSDKIDDVRVYNRALGVSEIQSLANPGAGVDAYGIPDSWKIQYFGSATGPGTGALEDWDHDGMCNYAEWKAGTIPNSATSVLKFAQILQSGTNLVISWQSVAGKFYSIQKSTNLLNGFPASLATGIPGTGGMNARTVQVDQAAGYYRVKLE